MSDSHFPWIQKKEAQSFGPFAFLNPTLRRYALDSQPAERESSSEQYQKPADTENGEFTAGHSPTKKRQEIRAKNVERKWRSRDNRKGKLTPVLHKSLLTHCTTPGRHAIVVTPAVDQNAQYLTPPPTNTLKEILKGIWRMFSTYPYWDVSYLVALIFTWGSVVWCINAFFVWLPLQMPSSEFPGEIADAGGITAFIGATIFEIGSVLLMIEAVNENRADCFGWALEEVLEERGHDEVETGWLCTPSSKQR